MPGHIAGRMILPGTKTPGKNFLRFRATGTVATGNVVSCTGVNGAFLKAARASAAVAADVRGPLYMAAGPAASGSDFQAISQGVIENVDTSAGALGDPVFLSTAGGFSLTAVGFTRRIGTIIVVGTTDGQILFDGGLSAGSTIKSGIAAVAGAVNVTVTAATLAGSFGGKPVTATTNTGTTIHVLTAVWSTDDLVITFSASYTGDVTYSIAVD